MYCCARNGFNKFYRLYDLFSGIQILLNIKFEPHRRHCVVSLSKNINPSLVLVQPRKTCPFITERLLMGRKESSQTNKTNSLACETTPVLFLTIQLLSEGYIERQQLFGDRKSKLSL